MTYSIRRIAAPCAFALLTTPALAQDSGSPDGWSVGIVTAIATNPYIGEGTDVLPYPSITYRKGPLSIGTFGLEYEVYGGEDLRLTAGIVPRFTGLFSTSAPELDGIDRNVTGDLALGLEYDFGQGLGTELTFRQEVTGDHDGQELVFELGYGTQLGNVFVDFRAGAGWQSDDLSAFIWGVAPDEARPGRPAYAPGDVVIPFVAVEAFLPLNEHWTLIGSARADFLPSEVTDSPIIDQDDIYAAFIGFDYQF